MERRSFLSGMAATVVKTMGGPPRHIASLALTVTIPAATTPEQRAILERLAHGCPVQRSLSTETRVEITFAPD